MQLGQLPNVTVAKPKATSLRERLTEHNQQFVLRVHRHNEIGLLPRSLISRPGGLSTFYDRVTAASRWVPRPQDVAVEKNVEERETDGEGVIDVESLDEVESEEKIRTIDPYTEDTSNMSGTGHISSIAPATSVIDVTYDPRSRRVTPYRPRQPPRVISPSSSISIAICVPTTSRGLPVMEKLTDLPFFSVLVPSVVATTMTDFEQAVRIFFYLGFDSGDSHVADTLLSVSLLVDLIQGEALQVLHQSREVLHHDVPHDPALVR